MTKGYLNPTGLDKYLYQNKAEILEGYDGCLLDNGLYSAKNGLIAVYEHYLNANSSDYLIIFARTEQEQNTLYNEFCENMKEQEEIA